MTAVLIVGSSQCARSLARRAVLELQPTWHVIEARSATDAISATMVVAFGIALTEHSTGFDGIAAASMLEAKAPHLIIVVSGAGRTHEVAATSERSGINYLQTAFDKSELEPLLVQSEIANIRTGRRDNPRQQEARRASDRKCCSARNE